MQDNLMETIGNTSCACETRANIGTVRNGRRSYLYLLAGVGGIIIWWFLYIHLKGIASFLTYDLLKMKPGSHLGAAIEFFFYDAPKVMLLLVVAVFGIGIIRSFFSPEKTRTILSGKSLFIGNILAALLGVVTPFCSCSAVPLFIGFVTAGVPLGVTFSFLISAPMVNEIALALLYGLVGWQIAAMYAATGLTIAVFAGWAIGRMHLEKHIEGWVTEIVAMNSNAPAQKLTWVDRILYGRDAVIEIVGRVWIYLLMGIAVGAGIHGFVPEGFMASVMGKGDWWSVPLSVVIGIPIYSSAAGVIPVVKALLGKGAALGSVLAFMMSVIALSLPEMIILRKVLKPRLIMAFVGVVGSGILLVGYLFNLVL
jgi:uncharacterized membrane protein YraQ (UPF0718 family)